MSKLAGNEKQIDTVATVGKRPAQPSDCEAKLAARIKSRGNVRSKCVYLCVCFVHASEYACIMCMCARVHVRACVHLCLCLYVYLCLYR